jgi:hypothetical protein
MSIVAEIAKEYAFAKALEVLKLITKKIEPSPTMRLTAGT